MKWKCSDLKCVRKPTRGRLSLTLTRTAVEHGLRLCMNTVCSHQNEMKCFVLRVTQVAPGTETGWNYIMIMIWSSENEFCDICNQCPSTLTQMWWKLVLLNSEMQAITDTVRLIRSSQIALTAWFRQCTDLMCWFDVVVACRSQSK